MGYCKGAKEEDWGIYLNHRKIFIQVGAKLYAVFERHPPVVIHIRHPFKTRYILISGKSIYNTKGAQFTQPTILSHWSTKDVDIIETQKTHILY